MIKGTQEVGRDAGPVREDVALDEVVQVDLLEGRWLRGRGVRFHDSNEGLDTKKWTNHNKSCLVSP